ncbi:uncharacterized protein GGS25DRAFT_492307 [Hypoxylon fragiforme]|uniref:uncharacterized protein n=1 Tax=Hypoxylon fragiforme TaxID=63214 RepID=UPI0020C64882|nr:uncharacterized protein GGS25DRAFT_492307 [Hypoxylon fragiforme]KAI2608953.1 hypothetical protein GGS25DRAFT_492307 [Hypoxylon fragiforme]
MRRPENWTLGEAFDKAFPWLRGTYILEIANSTVSTMMRETMNGHLSGGELDIYASYHIS